MPDLNAAEQDFLRGWRHVREGFFEVSGRDGDVLLADNLIDELPYRIHANVGPEVFDRMPPGSFLDTRVVPVAEDWLLSGSLAILGLDEGRDALASAAGLTTRRPDLVYANPAKFARGWGLQFSQHQAFVDYFGSDEIVVDADRFADTMRGYWARLGNEA